MMHAIRNWWSNLSLRERRLVGVAGGLAAVALVWLATFAATTALSDARTAHGLAVDRAAGIALRVEAIKALESSAAARPAVASAASLDVFIAQSAAEQGFTLSRNEPQGDAATIIAIANARAPALLGWLSTLEQDGLTTADVSIRPNADGTVALTATLRRPS